MKSIWEALYTSELGHVPFELWIGEQKAIEELMTEEYVRGELSYMGYLTLRSVGFTWELGCPKSEWELTNKATAVLREMKYYLATFISCTKLDHK